MRGKFLLSPKEKEWAYKKWCEGYTTSQIADALFCSEKTISRTAIRGRERIRPILVYEGERNDERTGD